MNRLKQYTTRHLKPWQYLILMVAVLCLIGTLLGTTMRAANGETQRTTSARMCTHTNLDGECWFGAKESAKKFRNGYFHESHGFPAKRIFKHPRAARYFFVKKLANRIGNLGTAHRSRIAWHFFGSGRVTTRTGCTSTYCYGCSDYCLAWKMYGELMRNAGCVGYGRPTTSKSTCQYPGTEASITKKGVQRGGALVICGVAVGIGILAAPESAGSSTVAAAGITGAVGCGWSFWSSFD